MDSYIGLIVLIYGIFLGSFFNVVGLRWIKDEKITGRSHCPKCNSTLYWYNLIPIFSYIFQGGKCHNCKVKIGLIYPVMELLTGVSYLLIYLVTGLSVDFIIAILFMSLLLVSGVTDYKEGLVLDKVVIPPMIVIMILTLIYKFDSVLLTVIPSVVIFLLLLIAVKLEKLGGGDVLIIAGTFLVHGFLLGSITMLFSAMTTLIYMLVSRRNKVPFIPFWVIGNILTYVVSYIGILDIIIK